MEISVYLKDYVEKLKKDKLKPFYNKKNNNFEIDNIYDYLKIIDILQNEKEKDRNNDPAWKFGENAASAKVGRRL